MTTADRILLVRAVSQRHDDLDRAFAPLVEIFRNHDFPLWEESWKTYEAYLAAIAREIGDSDGWLHWFIYDNAGGRRRFEAKAAAWSTPRPIRSARDLVRLLEADLPRP